MKALAYLLFLLLLAGGGGAAYFYLEMHKPMAEEHARMRIGMPEFEKASAELRNYRQRDAWIQPALSTLQAGLQEEIAAGKAEVVAATGGSVVVNIDENVLYLPGMVTFSKESPQTLEKLASVLKNLKDLKDKDILVGNTTESTKAQRVGRKKIPARSGRDIAMDRSAALVKFLEKRGIAEGSLASLALAPKPGSEGFRIKNRKTMIIIAPAASPLPATAAAPQARPVPPPAPPAPAPQQQTTQPPAQPKPIPIQPAPPARR